MADHHTGSAQIHIPRQDQVQRRAAERILFGSLVRTRVEDRNLATACNDQQVIIAAAIFKAHTSRPLKIERSG